MMTRNAWWRYMISFISNGFAANHSIFFSVPARYEQHDSSNFVHAAGKTMRTYHKIAVVEQCSCYGWSFSHMFELNSSKMST